jgi:nicotianamine synthase
MTQIVLKAMPVDSTAGNGLTIGEMQKLSLDGNNFNHDIGIGKTTNAYSRAVRRFVKRWRRAYNGETRSKDTASLSSSATSAIDGASIKSSMLYGVPRLATPDTDLMSEAASYEQQSDVIGDQKLAGIKSAKAATITLEAQKITDSVMRIHDQLTTMTSLKPCSEINALFSELVEIAIQIHPRDVTNLVSRHGKTAFNDWKLTISFKQVMCNPQILSVLSSLRAMASEAESCLEAHWAEHINKSHAQRSSQSGLANALPTCVIGNNSDKTFTTLRAFPYYQNYIDLANMELSAITPLLPRDKPLQKVAFIGSGPLPLTSICLAQILRDQSLSSFSTTKVEILNIDSCPQAISHSSTLSQLLGSYASSLSFACEEAGSLSRDLTPYDVVFLAALVGNTQEEKEKVLLRVVGQMKPGALVVVRTSHGLRGLLYPEFEIATNSILEKVQVEVVVHPWGWGGVVNSVIVARVK